MGVSVDEIKDVLRQYVLVKGNDAINEALVDRVAKIMLREFDVISLSGLSLGGGPIDLSNLTTADSREQAQEVIAAAPSSPRDRVGSVSSEAADVVASPVKQARPPKSHEEQVQEVEAERHSPPPPIPNEEERLKSRPAEGQRAVSTAQQSHFHEVINKVTAKIPDSAKRSGALPQDYDDMVEESLNDQVGSVDEEVVEVSEGSEGSEQVTDVSDTDLQEMFGSPGETIANPKDAIALQRALPRRLDDSSEASTQGNNRSISRIE